MEVDSEMAKKKCALCGKYFSDYGVFKEKAICRKCIREFYETAHLLYSRQTASRRLVR